MAFQWSICGIAGMVQASGSDLTLTTSVAGGVGFTAIIVAWLAQLNPVGILVVSLLFSVLEREVRLCSPPMAVRLLGRCVCRDHPVFVLDVNFSSDTVL